MNELADSQGKDCLLFGVLGADVDKKMEQRTGETLEILTINGADEPDNSAVLQSIAYFGKEEIGVCKDRRIKFTYFTPIQRGARRRRRERGEWYQMRTSVRPGVRKEPGLTRKGSPSGDAVGKSGLQGL